MTEWIVCVFFTVILVVTIYIIQLKRYRFVSWDALDIMTLVFVMYYVFPILLIDLPGGIIERVKMQGGKVPNSYWHVPIIIGIFYFSIWIGFNFFEKINERKLRLIPKKIGYKNNIFNKYKIVILTSGHQLFIRLSILIPTILTFVGLFAFFIRANDYGGVKKFFVYRNLIRLKLYDVAKGMSSIEYLFPCVTISFLFFFARFLYSKPTIRWRNKTFLPLLFSTSISLIIAFSSGSRGELLFLIVFFPLIMVTIYNESLPYRRIFALSPLFIFILHFGKDIFAHISGISTYNSLYSLIIHKNSIFTSLNYFDFIQDFSINFQHWIFSIPIALQYTQNFSQFGWFNEIITGFLTFLPKSWDLFPGLMNIQKFNTLLVYGNSIVERSSLPPGGIAYAIYSLQIPGVIIYGIFGGAIGKLVENNLRPIVKFHWSFLAVYVVFIQVWVFGFLGGDWLSFYRIFIVNIFVLLLPYLLNIIKFNPKYYVYLNKSKLI